MKSNIIMYISLLNCSITHFNSIQTYSHELKSYSSRIQGMSKSIKKRKSKIFRNLIIFDDKYKITRVIIIHRKCKISSLLY